MRFLPKFVWIAIPALAGCGLLSQVSNQSTANTKGGNSSLKLPQYPEDKDFLALAGVKGAEQYAQYLKPNIGLTEQELGITRAQLKKVEANIKAALIAKSIDDVAREIKKAKYGINAAKEYARRPDDVEPRAWRDQLLKEFKANASSPNPKQVLNEINNAKTTPSSINDDVADYLDNLARKALIDASVPNTNRLLQAKAFILAVHYAINSLSYDSINNTTGESQGSLHDAVTAKGMFVLNVARGVCYNKDVTFNLLIQAKSAVYHIDSEMRCINIKGSAEGGYTFGGVSYMHGDTVVKFLSLNKTEVYDSTHGLIFDSRDSDTAVALVAGSSGFIRQRPYTDPNQKYFKIAEGDPVSRLSLAQYLEIPSSIGAAARAALPRRSIGN